MAGALYEDTRNQAGHHDVKNEWWSAHGVTVIRKKLDFGDYADASGKSNVIVDTKQDLFEVAGNLGKQHERFVRELVRARDAGYRLIILVEQHAEYQSDRIKLASWVPYPCRRCGRCDPLEDKGCKRYRSRPLQGASMYRMMGTLEAKYGVRFMFCRKSDTAKTICGLLGVEYDRD